MAADLAPVTQAGIVRLRTNRHKASTLTTQSKTIGPANGSLLVNTVEMTSCSRSRTVFRTCFVIRQPHARADADILTTTTSRLTSLKTRCLPGICFGQSLSTWLAGKGRFPPVT